MSKLTYLWEVLRESLWFIPTCIVIGAIILALGLIELESAVERKQLAEHWPRVFFGADAEGSRTLLSAIASSMITVAGVTFSITVVALALASNQYTSRILRNFMRDRANQTVLGVFVGVFVYCLLVLRAIRGGDEGIFVPALAVFGALVLTLVAIGFFIFFIHHIAASIQATSIIESAAKETLQAIDRLFPEEIGKAIVERVDADLTIQAWVTIPAQQSGYIQGIDTEALLDIACAQDILVRMEKKVGDFVIEASPLVSVAGKPPDDEFIGELEAVYNINGKRTVEQDVAYGIRQIVDVALKALSPAINDTTTAIICVDFLGVILARLIGRHIEKTYRSDSGRLRLIARGPTFSQLLAEACDQIRQNAEGNVAVLTRLLQHLETLTKLTADTQRHQVLRQQAAVVIETAERSVPMAYDRMPIQAIRDRIFFSQPVDEGGQNHS
ncbi:DUF2254 domain-containing protein [Nitrosococcus watsonii]|uniref:DUF2254 domain-containing protein n=1 Tax=Nitrosococcus watsoni (strain C-113) TaxID=105559 RepID=D8KAJ0_NITWC|nr:DUF2254 domain-containing protein [Nitrosococcus watsonii]ADJ29417.1 Protein of unknown function DUF2254, membrane [Nitrosococcus watsonii C-113]